MRTYRDFISQQAVLHLAVNEPLLHRWLCSVTIEDSASAHVRIDGYRVYLGVNSEWFSTLPEAQKFGVFAHELLHVMLAATARSKGLNGRRFNIAQDILINEMLMADGFELPENRCDGSMLNMSREAVLSRTTEELYDLLPDQGGENFDEHHQIPAEVAQGIKAALGRMGIGSGSLKTALTLLRDSVSEVDWRSQLRTIPTCIRTSSRKQTVIRRHRRYALPYTGTKRVRKASILVVVDTSGSIDAEQLSKFNAEIEKMHKSAAAAIDVVCCDTEVGAVQKMPCRIEYTGGGGTDMAPAFALSNKYQGVICLTDGYMSFPDKPKVPVYWCLTTRNITPPYGRAIYLK